MTLDFTLIGSSLHMYAPRALPSTVLFSTVFMLIVLLSCPSPSRLFNPKIETMDCLLWHTWICF